MLNAWTILLLSLGYLSLLFTIANVGDRRAQVGRSLISNPYIYALSMAVYCTAWTFYGSVGRAASTGVGFLPIYLGPTLMAPLWWLVLRKIIRISKVHRITAIADFIAARYGKTNRLAGLVTLIAVLGVVPYIALQLKAISTSFQVLTAYPSAPAAGPTGPELVAYVQDPGFLMVIGLALFTILFGARHLDATERHEGLVAAIAFESIVKLVAFLAVGLFVTYGMYEGLGDIFDQAAAQPALDALFLMDHEALPASTWIWHTALSMLAILFLPRQFQVAVVENVDERHLDKAIWLFPLYLFLINLFVLPIAFGGLLAFPDGTVDADTFVLTLPLAAGRVDLALLAYLGGLSAATGMVIVATIALSTMISNDLVMPTLLRIPALRLDAQGDLTTLLLRIRRGSIVVVLLMAYVYFNLVGAVYDLVSIGLISFAAVAQFGPALLGGIYWKRGTRAGALAGLLVGFLVWIYTLALPSLAQPGGLLPPSFLTDGPWGLTLLHPYQLFGLTGLDTISHALFWSLLLNTGLYVGVSLFTRRSVLERVQAVAFVDVFAAPTAPFVRGTARIQDVQTLLARFMGLDKAQAALGGYAARHHVDLRRTREADPDLIQHAETVLAGTIGSASARLMIATVVQERPFSMDEVLHILDETQEVIAYSQALEQKSRDLEQAKEALQQANDRLQDLDRMKDDFVSTVTHELRTPLTSVRAFAEILHDNPSLPPTQREEFLQIIMKESTRLSRLINQVLDFQKIETGAMEWHPEPLQVDQVVHGALLTLQQLFTERGITVQTSAPPTLPPITGDADRLTQVLVNLLSNAAKFCDPEAGRITVALSVEGNDETAQQVRIDVTDNGRGLPPDQLEAVFEKFKQVEVDVGTRPPGSGLGLTIARRIVAHHGGMIWAANAPDQGAMFSVRLPAIPTAQPTAPLPS